jgi:hypothetical protein
MEVAVVVYLDQYRKANAVNVIASPYEQEKLCVNGNSMRGIIAMPCKQHVNDLSPELPEDLTQVDIEALLGRVYALASQI